MNPVPTARTAAPHTPMHPRSRAQQIASWLCRLLAAGILLQTLFFKFTGAEESRYIFTTVGLEPWGRYASGVAELIAAGLLLTPRLVWAGALLALGVMAGAILAHLTVLGVVVQNDSGLLFGLAIVVTGCSLAALWLNRGAIPGFRHRLEARHA